MASRKFPVAKTIILVVFALLLIVGYLGGDVTHLDSLNIIAPIWVITGLACLLYICARSFFAHRRPVIGWVAALILGGYMTFAAIMAQPWFNSNSQLSNQTNLESIKLISFNARKDNRHATSAARWIGNQSADLVLLLEVDKRSSEMVRLLRVDYPFQYDCRGDGRCSTLLLSKAPAASVEYHGTGDTENRKSLSALTAKFPVGGRQISITAAHLPRPWPMGGPRKFSNELLGVTDVFDGMRIVAGDFNNPPWTFFMQGWAHDMQLNLVSGVIPTWPSGSHVPELLALDQVYVGDCIRPISVKSGPHLGSDHLPLISELQIIECDA